MTFHVMSFSIWTFILLDSQACSQLSATLNPARRLLQSELQAAWTAVHWPLAASVAETRRLACGRWRPVAPGSQPAGGAGGGQRANISDLVRTSRRFEKATCVDKKTYMCYVCTLHMIYACIYIWNSKYIDKYINEYIHTKRINTWMNTAIQKWLTTRVNQQVNTRIDKRS